MAKVRIWHPWTQNADSPIAEAHNEPLEYNIAVGKRHHLAVAEQQNRPPSPGMFIEAVVFL